MIFAAGSRVGRYQIVAPLGAGGMGRCIARAIDRIDLATGARTRWHDVRPSDPAGIVDIQPIFMTRDGNHYAYAYRRFISDLYIVEGLL